MTIEAIFFDFSKKGKDVLGTKDVPSLTNEFAVKESLSNLMSTEIGSRIMEPLYGINIEQYLFEPMDEITTNSIKYSITDAIERFDDRVTDVEVDIIPNLETQTYIVNINYAIIYTNKSDVLQLSFEKVR